MYEFVTCITMIVMWFFVEEVEEWDAHDRVPAGPQNSGDFTK